MNTIESNKRLITDYLDALSGKPKPREVVARFVADDHLMEHIQQVEQAFPAYRLIIRQMIGENDWVVARATFSGVHRAEFAGISATGREVEADAVIFYRIQDERIVEHHLQFDLAALMGQLQAASTGAASASR
jgi:predicted ester cyclase